MNRKKGLLLTIVVCSTFVTLPGVSAAEGVRSPYSNNFEYRTNQDHKKQKAPSATAGDWFALGAAVLGAAVIGSWLSGGSNQAEDVPNQKRYRQYQAPSSSQGGYGQSAPPINSFYGDCHGGKFYGC